MKITFTKVGWEDYLWFQENDKRLLKRINLLIKEILLKALANQKC